MISIIITSFKEASTIGKAIESFLTQNLRNFEILVVAPDKETLKMASHYPVRLIKDPGRGKPTALNLVINESKGDILILTDGDVFSSKHSVDSLVSYFDDERVGAVSGRPISINKRDSLFGFWSHFLVDAAHKMRLTHNNTFCSGYLYAIRKKLYKNIPEDTLSDDALISLYILEQEYKIKYESKAEVYVKFPSNLKDWITQKRRSVGGYVQIKEWTGKSLRSFKQESLGIRFLINYPKNIKEFSYVLLLVFVRIYLWIIIYIDQSIKKKSFKEIWKRVESTK